MMAVWGMEPDKRTSLIPVWNGAVCAKKGVLWNRTKEHSGLPGLQDRQ